MMCLYSEPPAAMVIMNQSIDSLCLLKGKSDTIYLFMDGFKHAILSPDDADAYQLDLNSVKYCSEDALNEIPSGKKTYFYFA